MTGPIRVLIVDDHSLVRAGFQSILNIEVDIEVVGEAKDGVEAVALAAATIPDVVLMDIRMPEMDGLEATRLITSTPGLQRTRVVVLTTFDLDEYVFGALRAGASGFLLKGVEPPALIEAVRTVARGDALLDPGATRRLIEAYVDSQSPDPGPRLAIPESLTGRELEILGLIAAGMNNSEIAGRGCSSARSLASPMCRGSLPNSMPETRPNWSSLPTRRAWSCPVNRLDRPRLLPRSSRP